jgi:hypothetical protein
MNARLAASLLLAAACGAAQAQSLSACEEAARNYDAMRASNAQSGKDAGMAQARSLVMQECFSPPASASSAAQRARTAPQRIEVDRPASIIAPAIKPAPAPALPSPPRAPSAPSVIGLCDAGGCWDNLGRRYNGTGSILYGPGGSTCVRSGDMIECR